MRKRVTERAVLLVVLASMLVPAGALAGSTQATVQVSQNGEVQSSFPVATQVAVSGTGYKRGGLLSVCIGGSCDFATADRDGAFYEARTLYELGTISVRVYERNANLSNARLRATTTITVTP